jgi:PEP-CTERM motif
MKTSKLLVGIPTLVCAMLFVSNAFASVVPVTNPSFETLPAGGLPNSCGTGCSFSIDAIFGWTNSGESGQFQPGPPATTTYFNSLSSDGTPTVAFADDPGSTISQIVGPTVQNGVTYTLQVDIGARKDFPMDATADLKFGTTVCNPASGSAPSVGGWSTITATCTGTLATAGEHITIELNTIGKQGDFDNVRLTDSVTTAPEPGTLILFGTGLLGLVHQLRRKRFAQS